MKSIDNKTLFQAGRDGKTDVKKYAIPGIAPKQVEDIDIDDRDPMDRVADELIRFTETVQKMNADQAQAMVKLLTLIIDAVAKIGQVKNSASTPLKVDITDTRPKEWNLKITNRDSKGFIEGVKLVAN